MPIAAFLLIAVTSLLPGYFFIYNLPQKSRNLLVNDASLLPVSFGLSVIAIAAIQFSTYILNGSAVTNSVIYGLITGILFAGAWRQRADFVLPKLWLPFFIFLLYLFVLLALVPSYQTGFTSDWGLYFPTSFVYLNKASPAAFSQGLLLEYLIKRTPLMSLYGSFYLSFFGQVYAYFQLACAFENALIFSAIYLIADKCFGKRAALFALILTPLSPALMRAISVPEPKISATFFLMLAAYYYLLARDNPPEQSMISLGALAGVFSVAAFMSHPSMLFYLIWIYADQLYLKIVKHRNFNRQLWFASLAAGLILAAPWYAWAIKALGVGKVLSPSSTISQPLNLSLWQYLTTRLAMIASSLLIPLPLAQAIYTGQFPWSSLLSTAIGSPLNYWGTWILRFYDQTFIGGMTITLSAAIIAVECLKHPKLSESTARRPFSLWMCLGALACFLAHLGIVDTKGHATNLMAPVFILWLCYAGSLLKDLRPRILGLLISMAAIEFIYSRLLVSFLTKDINKMQLIYLYAFTKQWLGDLNPTILSPLAVMLMVLYWTVIWTQAQKLVPVSQPGQRGGKKSKLR